MTALIVILTVIVALLAVLVAGLLRSHAEILRALHELGVGEDGRASRTPALKTHDGVAEPRTTTTPAFDLTGTKTDGAAKHVGVIDTEHTTLLAFMTTGCSTCQIFWKEFGQQPNLDLPGFDTRLVIVTKGLDRESDSRLAKLAPRHHPLVMSTQAWDDYQIPVSPYFILVDGPSGKIVGEGSAGSWKQVRSLLKQAYADSTVRTRSRLSGADRELRADDELRAAGIEPGDASLYPTDAPESET